MINGWFFVLDLFTIDPSHNCKCMKICMILFLLLLGRKYRRSLYVYGSFAIGTEFSYNIQLSFSLVQRSNCMFAIRQTIAPLAYIVLKHIMVSLICFKIFYCNLAVWLYNLELLFEQAYYE